MYMYAAIRGWILQPDFLWVPVIYTKTLSCFITYAPVHRQHGGYQHISNCKYKHFYLLWDSLIKEEEKSHIKLFLFVYVYKYR